MLCVLVERSISFSQGVHLVFGLNSLSNRRSHQPFPVNVTFKSSKDLSWLIPEQLWKPGMLTAFPTVVPNETEFFFTETETANYAVYLLEELLICTLRI